MAKKKQNWLAQNWIKLAIALVVIGGGTLIWFTYGEDFTSQTQTTIGINVGMFDTLDPGNCHFTFWCRKIEPNWG